MQSDLAFHIFGRFCFWPDMDLPCVAMQVHIDDTCLNVFVGAKWFGYKDKVSADYFFLQEILADIITYTSQSTCSGLGQIIFIHLISRFWSGGGIVRSFHNCIYIIL